MGKHSEKAHSLMGRTGYASGGAVKSCIGHEDEMPSMKRKEGGAVEGRANGGRLDKLARGGRTSKKPVVTVNIIQAPKEEAAAPMPMPKPPMPMPPSPGPGPAMGAGAPPPMGLKTGGRLGGKAAPKMTAGAVSGEGRLQKIKAYGTKPKAK